VGECVERWIGVERVGVGRRVVRGRGAVKKTDDDARARRGVGWTRSRVRVRYGTAV
jgi:hypothetical protein